MTQRRFLPVILLSLSTLSAVPAFAGICSGGPNNGRTCTYNWECGAWCASGPRTGRSCSANWECGETCSTGPRAGNTCSDDWECGRTCVGGSAAGLSCTGNFECPGGSCRQHLCAQHLCRQFLCAGGLGFAAGTDLASVCMDEIFAPEQPAAERAGSAAD